MPCAAQDDPLEPPDLEQYYRWGPLRARPGVRLRNVGYNSNIFNSAIPQGDFQATVEPRLKGLFLFGDTAFLDFDAALAYTLYSEFSSINYFDWRSDGRFTLPLGRFGVFAEAQYDRVRQIPVDEFDIRPMQILFRHGPGIVFNAGWRTTLELTHFISRVTWQDDDFQGRGVDFEAIQNRRERITNLKGAYRVFGRSRVSLEVSAGRIEFDEPNLEGEAGFDRDSDVNRVLVGFEAGSGGRLVGEIRVGWADLDHDGPNILDYNGPVGDMEWFYRPRGGLRVRLRGYRRVGFSTSSANNYYTLDELELTAVYYLNRIFGLEGIIDRGRLGIPGDGRIDQLYSYEAGIRLRTLENSIGNGVEYSLLIGRAHRDSNLDFLDRDRNTVSFNASFGF